jgi:anti-sigma factor RsiW
MRTIMNAIDDRTLEALVDGELSEAERGDVLGQLDHSPDGWRRLALTFLADQTLRQSLAATRAVALNDVPVRWTMPGAGIAKPRAAMRRWLIGAAACAACALLAFFLGMWSVPESVKVVQLPPALPGPDLATAQTTVQEKVQQETPPMPTLTPSARKELERRGFVIQERPRVVPVQHQDGRMIKVLVNEIEVRFVGRQSIL